MRRIKRWYVPVGMLAALMALTVPAMASAAQLETPAKMLLKVGSKVVLTSHNFGEHIGGMSIECGEVKFDGVVSKNGGSTVAIGGTEPSKPKAAD